MNNALIKLAYKPINRSQKREALKEKKKILEMLLTIELNFTDQLFQDSYDYLELYNFYLDLYCLTAQKITLEQKPKFFKPNFYYFETQYKPSENINKISNTKQTAEVFGNAETN